MESRRFSIIGVVGISEWIKFNRGKRCRARCGMCNKAWHETQTDEVHMIETSLEKNGKFVPVLSYICDTCKSKLQ